jgi:transcriptional regulator with XRE-family HTH domain
MTDEVYARVGAAIRARRDAEGLTQSALALASGLKRTTVTNIESGGQAVTLLQLMQVATALGTSAAGILEQAERMDISAATARPTDRLASELLARMGDAGRAAR